jgi:hypothetical protein
MKPKFYVFLIVLFASLITGNLISQPTFGQSEFLKDFAQWEKEKFLELGEEKLEKIVITSLISIMKAGNPQDRRI